jgi:hypothetical protein
MPKRRPYRFQLAKISKLRWSTQNISVEDHSSDEDFQMGSNEMIIDDKTDNINWTDKIILNYIGDLLEVCINECSYKTISTLIYMILKHFNFTWRDIDNFMSNIGAMRCATAKKWAETFINDDFEMFIKDGRGGKRGDSFFDIYPELEVDAKSFAAASCSRKAADFRSIDLANYIDSAYYKLTNTKKSHEELIRSNNMCRLDLRRWGYRFDLNTQRPYYIGHDRKDVLDYREIFLEYFLSKKHHYYLVDPGDYPNWCIPTGQPRILICKLKNFNRKFIF